MDNMDLTLYLVSLIMGMIVDSSRITISEIRTHNLSVIGKLHPRIELEFTRPHIIPILNNVLS